MRQARMLHLSKASGRQLMEHSKITQQPRMHIIRIASRKARTPRPHKIVFLNGAKPTNLI